MLSFLAQWSIFVILSALAGATALLWALRMGRDRNRPGVLDYAAAWVTIFLSVIVAAETLLGLLGWLTVLATSALVALTLAISVALCRREARLLLRPSQLALPLMASWDRLQASLPRGILALLLWLVASVVLAALAEPSVVFDTYVYHMPMVVNWSQAHSLVPTYVPFADVANSYFPGNGELLYLWAFAPFHNDLLVRLVSAGLWGVLGVAIYRVCRIVGSSISGSLVVTLILWVSPVVLAQATESSLDVASAALFVLALGHLLSYARSPDLQGTVLFGLASGLCLGTKYSGPACILLLLAGLVVIMIRMWRAHPVRIAAARLLVALLATLFLGGFWYIRNLVLAKNPFYPVRVAISGHVIFDGPGLTYSPILWQHLPEIPVGELLRSVVKAHGVFLGFVALVSLATLVGWIVKHSRFTTTGLALREVNWTNLGVIGGMFVCCLGLYLNTPYSVMRFNPSTPITADVLAAGARFSLNAVALLAVILAWSLGGGRRAQGALWLAVCFAVVQAVLAGYDPLTYSFFGGRIFTTSRLAIVGVCICAALYLFQSLRETGHLNRFCRMSPALGAFLCAGVLLLAGASLYGVLQYREALRPAVQYRRFAAHAEGWQWISQNVARARIAYTGGALSYGLYGQKLDNQVRYINITGSLDDRYHDYFLRGTGYRSDGSYDQWLRNLGTWGAKYVVLTHFDRAVESEWVAAHPETFELQYANDAIRIYAVRLRP